MHRLIPTPFSVNNNDFIIDMRTVTMSSVNKLYNMNPIPWFGLQKRKPVLLSMYIFTWFREGKHSTGLMKVR